MEDARIVQLYWERNEAAISATADKYGAYCASIARNILGDPEDVEECVSDTYLRAWNAIPPHRPQILPAFLGRITRNLALNRYRHSRADKRGGGRLPAVLEELSFVTGGEDAEQALDRREVVDAVNSFLAGLPARKRTIFLCRYWYLDSIAEIGARFGMTEGSVSVTLSRLRRKLRVHLLERGIDV